jgi:hypothetical protein
MPGLTQALLIIALDKPGPQDPYRDAQTLLCYGHKNIYLAQFCDTPTTTLGPIEDIDQLQLVPSGGDSGPRRDQHGTQMFCHLHPGPTSWDKTFVKCMELVS